jgi:hypothetical protein
MTNYQNGKIYSIRSRSCDLVYVGSTTQRLSKRFGQHKSTSCNCRSRQIIEIGDSYIELLESYPCLNKEELCRREGEVIRTIDCVNRYVAGRTKAEWFQDNAEHVATYKKQYYQDNAEQIATQKKEYYQNNAEQIATQKKEYYKDNAERIKQYQQDNAEHIVTYRKQYSQDNAEHIASRAKQYQQDNAEHIATLQKQYRQATKNIQTCICGAAYNYGNNRDRYRHYRTAKHSKFVHEIHERLREQNQSVLFIDL